MHGPRRKELTMKDRSDASPKGRTDEPAPWFLSEWTGPVVERRPSDAGPEWPSSAVERVTFTDEDFPDFKKDGIDSLPYTSYYDADGWPTHCPKDVRPYLDPRMKAEFHRCPWTLYEHKWTRSIDWRMFAGDYDRYRRLNMLISMPDGLPPPIASKRTTDSSHDRNG